MLYQEQVLSRKLQSMDDVTMACNKENITANTHCEFYIAAKNLM